MAFASGKVILFGEHAVVYGHTAVAAAISRGVTASAHRAEQSSLSVGPIGLHVALAAQIATVPDDPTTRVLASAYRELANHYAGPHHSVVASVDLPLGGGLGSSAALGVAVIRALDDAHGVMRESKAVRALADAWERHFHGNPSGLDVATCVHGGVIRFRKGAEPEVVSVGAPLSFVVAYSGRPSSTRAMVDAVATRRAAMPDAVATSFKQIEQCADAGLMALVRDDRAELGRLLRANHEALRSLGVSTPQLDALVESAIAKGALGAKLTGAGGGGCTIALARDAAHATSIVDFFHASGTAAFSAEVRP